MSRLSLTPSPGSAIRWSARPAITALLILILAGTGPLAAKKKYKEEPKKGMTGHTFVNETDQTVYGLKVQLNKKAEIITNSETRRPGPFRNVKGNGSTSFGLSNPVEPIEPGSDSFELLFRSYKSGLKITKWWWLDEKGRQIGQKQTPK